MTSFQYTVTKEDQQEKRAVRDLLRTHFQFSRRLKLKLKDNNLILLNGLPVRMHILPLAGDQLTVSLPEETSRFTPEPIPVDILYEDELLMMVNKQPGLVVHPTTGQPRHTLANGLAQYMLDTGESFKIRFINRLDRDTSGIVAVAKQSLAQDDFIRQAEAGTVSKIYLALVRGILREDRGVISLPIGRPDPLRPERAVLDPAEGGALSVTRFQTEARFSQGYSLLRLRLETGRTHQIRVHLSHLGHPVAGDSLYGGADPLIGRQALHAAELSFLHPVSGKPLSFRAPLPADIRLALDRLSPL